MILRKDIYLTFLHLLDLTSTDQDRTTRVPEYQPPLLRGTRNTA